MIDWLESSRAQIWYDRHSKNWVCQVIVNHAVIQPSRGTLRAAITDANAEWVKQSYFAAKKGETKNES